MSKKKRVNKSEMTKGEEILHTLTNPFLVISACLILLFLINAKTMTFDDNSNSKYDIAVIEDNDTKIIVIQENYFEEETCGSGLVDSSKTISEECNQYTHKHQIINQIGSTSDEDKAMDLCNCLLKLNERDECYYEIAKTLKKSSFCDVIETVARADLCYMQFVYKGDFSVCSKINDANVRQSCFYLKDLSVFHG